MTVDEQPCLGSWELHLLGECTSCRRLLCSLLAAVVARIVFRRVSETDCASSLLELLRLVARSAAQSSTIHFDVCRAKYFTGMANHSKYDRRFGPGSRQDCVIFHAYECIQ